MPRPDPVPSPRHSALRRFRRIMKYMALVSLFTAVFAVVLVAWGSEGVHIHMLIATALGVGLTVFLATALMSLAFLSSSSGHDELASRTKKDSDQ
jgi:peptidoglycan/LPS O-acetylase OafA/YrhL